MKLMILNPDMPANAVTLIHAVEDVVSPAPGEEFFLTSKTDDIFELVVDMDDIRLMDRLCGFLYAMAKKIQYAVYDHCVKHGRVHKDAVTPEWYRCEISKELRNEQRNCYWQEVEVVRDVLGIMAQNQRQEGDRNTASYKKLTKKRLLLLVKAVCAEVDLEDICDEAKRRPATPGARAAQTEGA